MKSGVSFIGIIVTVTVGISSIPLLAASVTNHAAGPTTSNGRIDAMMRRLDRFEVRQHREARLYAKLDRAGVQVASARKP